MLPEVREWLAQKGYDKLMGARPMRRLIEDRIKKPLANGNLRAYFYLYEL